MPKLRAPDNCDEASVGTTLYRVGPDGCVTATQDDAVALLAAGFLFVDDEAEEPAEEPAAE